ncbi:ATP-binding cassette domain-containing protein [Streptomyces lydicus]|uniref:ABC transporter ATP-binding protein n=1 Tax=Streptomyces lydicus TaxID=47763 RepID=UPI003798E67D
MTTAIGSAPAIEVDGLHKSFGRTDALDGLDLTVEAGEVHGFLGPNGAGKSTTIRVLLGLLRADRGTARLLGKDPWHDAVALHRRIAYVPGDVTLWRNLSGGEVIDLYGRLRGGLDGARRAELLERFELDPTKKGRTYSKGNRQKVALVAAFASDVDLLILDEPTSGLDPLMEEVFQTCVAEERDRGRTVLLSSHVLSEVEALCDRVSIIRKGRTVESGSLGELRHLTRTSVVAELAGPPEAAGGGLGALPGVHDLTTQPIKGGQGHRVRLQVDNDKLDAVLRSLGSSGVRSLTSTPPTLEELFLRHYHDDVRGAVRDDAAAVR